MRAYTPIYIRMQALFEVFYNYNVCTSRLGLNMVTYNDLISLFDYKDGGLVSKKTGCRAGYKTKLGYRRIRVNDKYHLEHRLIWLMFYEETPDEIDHINGIPDDNRLENLRPCTRTENLYNSKMRINNSSGVKGVYWNKQRRCWEAGIRVEGEKLYLGSFTDIEEARKTVESARKYYHGEFARNS